MLPNDECLPNTAPGTGSFTKKRKMKKKQIYKNIIGFILLPFAFILFFFDRMILVFLPHLDSENMKTWFNNTKLMMLSLIRTSIVFGIILIWKFIQYRING